MEEREFQQFIRFLEYYTTPEGTPEFKRIQAIAHIIAQKIYAEISLLETKRLELIQKSEESELNLRTESIRIQEKIEWLKKYLHNLREAKIEFVHSTWKPHRINPQTLERLETLSPEIKELLPSIQGNKIHLPFYRGNFVKPDGKTESFTGPYAKILFKPDENTLGILEEAKDACEKERQNRIKKTQAKIEELDRKLIILEKTTPTKEPYNNSIVQITEEIRTKREEIQRLLLIPKDKWEALENILNSQND